MCQPRRLLRGTLLPAAICLLPTAQAVLLDTWRPRSATIEHDSMPEKEESVNTSGLRGRLRAARSVFVLTGAGVSAESGVPTFRGGGQAAVWKGMPFDVISSGSMLEKDLPAVWEWFNYRRGVLRALKPTAAHEPIAGWQDPFEQFT